MSAPPWQADPMPMAPPPPRRERDPLAGVSFIEVRERQSKERRRRDLFVASTVAATVEAVLMHPLDVVKTRVQATVVEAGAQRPDMWTMMARMVRTEGPGSLYRGLVPQMLALVPQKATKFFAFHYVKHMLPMSSSTNRLTKGMVASCVTGVVEGLVSTPFECAKVNLQVLGAEAPATGTVLQMVRTEGLASLYKGLLPNILRHSFFNAAYFCSYELMRELLPPAGTRGREVATTVGCGFTAGVLGSVVGSPWDVIKTRLMTQATRKASEALGAERPYDGWLDALQKIPREEGPTALFRGLVPRLLRLGVGGAILFTAYDTALNAISYQRDRKKKRQ